MLKKLAELFNYLLGAFGFVLPLGERLRLNANPLEADIERELEECPTADYAAMHLQDTYGSFSLERVSFEDFKAIPVSPCDLEPPKVQGLLTRRQYDEQRATQDNRDHGEDVCRDVAAGEDDGSAGR